ncbi:Bowman-Birk type trypsin inhibitor [Rhynchospora pubera]|uniref:Bowman-Birk type trypsin inhibitor n=1 Tax=Rhynchospora pubera TaxID=906938 RepID=A0AAV8GSN1_9POAL|nr:Bowman-Birk type trypsin inhibitor [Rhynchospora pubera]
MGRIATSSSFSFVFFVIMLSLLSAVAAKQVGSWPCCDNCGSCTKSFPPLCHCLDLHLSCPPDCESCIEVDQDPALSYPTCKYRCEDLIVNFCKYTCTSASVLNQ